MGVYSFAPSASQKDSLEYRSYEDVMRGALLVRGFREAQPARYRVAFDWTVQDGSRNVTRSAPVFSPTFGLGYGSFGGWGGGWGGVGMRFGYPYYPYGWGGWPGYVNVPSVERVVELIVTMAVMSLALALIGGLLVQVIRTTGTGVRTRTATDQGARGCTSWTLSAQPPTPLGARAPRQHHRRWAERGRPAPSWNSCPDEVVPAPGARQPVRPGGLTQLSQAPQCLRRQLSHRSLGQPHAPSRSFSSSPTCTLWGAVLTVATPRTGRCLRPRGWVRCCSTGSRPTGK